MSWFKSKVADRFKEPSSLAGVGLVVGGLGQVFGVNEAPQVAEAINQAAQQSSWLGALMVAVGTAAILMREKGGKDAK